MTFSDALETKRFALEAICPIFVFVILIDRTADANPGHWSNDSRVRCRARTYAIAILGLCAACV